jgi:putative molybdopterin biosynthesis protein
VEATIASGSAEQEATPSLWTIPAAARRLGVSIGRCYELAREGLIPTVRLGRQLRVDPQALDEWIRRGGKALPGGWRKD